MLNALKMAAIATVAIAGLFVASSNADAAWVYRPRVVAPVARVVAPPYPIARRVVAAPVYRPIYRPYPVYRPYYGGGVSVGVYGGMGRGVYVGGW